MSRLEEARAKMQASAHERECWECSGRKIGFDGGKCQSCDGAGVSTVFDPQLRYEYERLCDDEDSRRARARR